MGEPIPLHPALLVDDDPRMRRRLCRLLAPFVSSTDTGASVAKSASVAGAMKTLQRTDFAFAVIDIGLPDGSGIDLITWLHHHHPHTTAVVVSTWGDEETVLAALQAGAVGYLLKERDDDELRLALRNIQRGGAPIDPFVARRILALLPTPPHAKNAAKPRKSTACSLAELSEREAEILHMVARGYSNRQIAELTTLSHLTIESYTKTIYRKLAVGSRTAAVFVAKSRGLLR